jgi:hypothetical protein
MRKICLTVVGFYLMMLSALSQDHNADTSSYQSKKLSVEEVNLVSGYYTQDGTHSAVTGGIGTQKLNDISNVIDLKFVSNDSHNNKNILSFEAGIDHHTAASQAYVSATGASQSGGTRIYPSINWQIEKNNGFNFGLGAGLSNEYNYHSKSLNFSLGKISKNKNTEISFKGQAFFDKVTMIEPSELIPKVTQTSITTYTTASGNVIRSGDRRSGEVNIPKSARNTFSGSLTLSQVVNKNLQVALVTDVVAQNGFLSLPFHRVYFQGKDSAKIENLPGNRLKFPVGLRLNYFLGDKIIFRTYYRYYTDDWGIKAHTASLEVPYKISPFVSVSPFYRYYIQTAADYFAPYKQHLTAESFYTSNYDLSAFSSQYFGVNLKITPKSGVLNIPLFNTLEVRYGHYLQTTGLQADNIGISFNFK